MMAHLLRYLDPSSPLQIKKQQKKKMPKFYPLWQKQADQRVHTLDHLWWVSRWVMKFL